MAPTGSKCPVCRRADARVFGEPDLQIRAPCSACADKLAAEALAKQNRDQLADLHERWSKLPALYRTTDPNHPHVNPRILAEVLKYDPRSSNGKGIGLYGPTGAGKTRMMFLLVRKLHFSGVKILFTSAVAIARAASQEFDDDQKTRGEARLLLRNAVTSEVLFIDDIGKERLTEAAELKLYWLIEERTANYRPILWTSNFVGADLRKMMSDNRGTAVTRRLAEFSSVLFVPAPYVQENERRFA
jgi:DNA replication protein DnaC